MGDKLVMKNYFRISLLLRYLIFISFYILSIRFILIHIERAPIQNPIQLVFPLFAIAILSLWKTSWCLYGFLIIIPLISGLQMLGLIQTIPLISLIFATIYLSWLPKRLFFEKGDISPRTRVGSLADILSAIVLLSLMFILIPYPPNVIVDLTWYIPSDMRESFYSIEAAYVILQGLLFFRMMELEIKHHSPSKYVVPVLYAQALIIIFYSMIQLIFRLPELYQGVGIFAPFGDIHSYGSYMVVLFFVFLGIMFVGRLWHKLFNGVYTAFFFLFAVLSYSRATWVALMIVGTVFIMRKLSIRKQVILIFCMFLGLLYLNLFPDFFVKSKEPYVQRLGNLLVVKQLGYDRGIDARVDLWKRAVDIISDFPITGSGIGTFYRISPLYQDLNIVEYRDFYENVHNYFLQFTSELGIPALLIFSSILYFTYKTGLSSSPQTPESGMPVKGILFGLSAYLITSMTGQPLLLSDQQFLFWFVISSIALSQPVLNYQGLFSNLSKKTSIWMLILGTGIVLITAYDFNFGRIREYEYGFYPYELWDGKKVRWTWKKASLQTITKGNVMEFDVHALPYNIGPKGLNFKLLINDQLWDEIHFLNSETRNLKYYIPYKKDDLVKIEIILNKTFIPVRLGLSRDGRDLGVAISEIKFSDELPKDHVGFFGVETWEGIEIPGWPPNIPKKVRWTGLSASMNIRDVKEGFTLFLMAAHPDTWKNPVRLEIQRDGKTIKEIIFTDSQWKRIRLDQNTLRDSKVLTFHVSRTWNPKLLGFSSDSRDLGVAIGILGNP